MAARFPYFKHSAKSIPSSKFVLQKLNLSTITRYTIRYAASLQKRLHASISQGDTFSAAAPGGSWELREERGVVFVTGDAFYRAESCAGRDLAVLAAALHRQRTGSLRVLDVMAGSGMRGARYLVQADADEVWINDGRSDLHSSMVYNMCTAAAIPVPGGGQYQQSPVPSAVMAPVERPAETVAAERGDIAGGLGPLYEDADAAGGTRSLAEPQALHELAVNWDCQAVRLHLEGLARDVWQWEVERPPDTSSSSPQPGQPRGPITETPSALTSGEAMGDESCGSDDPARGSICVHHHHETRSCMPTTCDATMPGGTEERGSSRDNAATKGGSSTDYVNPGEARKTDEPAPKRRRIRISHVDANRLLTNCYMRESYYDMIDIDSFGSETMHFPVAVDAVRYGGLLYLTSTDGFTSSGKRPERGLAAYGCYARALPWSNEQGLRMVIGAAVREAAARGVALTPVFSLYSYHGPVFRVMLRARRSADWPVHHYGFVGHCFVHGDNYTVGWSGLSAATCRCEARGRLRSTDHGLAGISGADAPETAGDPPGHLAAGTSGNTTTTASRGLSGCQRGGHSAIERLDDAGFGAASNDVHSGGGSSSSTPLVLSGPMWTGPLHDELELRAMKTEAQRRGWTGFGIGPTEAPHLLNRVKSSRNVRPLEELLEVMLEEADPLLPPGFFSIDKSVARRLERPPPRDGLIAALRAEGFAAARCHLEARAFRTNASMEDVLWVAETRLGIARRVRR